MNIVNFITSVENLINKNNTTTATNDISSGLSSRVGTIIKGIGGANEIIPIPITKYPAIIVEFKNKSDNFSQVGNSAKRKMDVDFDICGITHCGVRSGDTDGFENASMESIKLIQNIENVIRNNVRLSQTSICMQCLIVGTDFKLRDNDATYNHIGKISCRATLLSE